MKSRMNKSRIITVLLGIAILSAIVCPALAITHHPPYVSGGIGDVCTASGTGVIIGHEKDIDTSQGKWIFKHAWEAFPPVGAAACRAYGYLSVATIYASSANDISVTGNFMVNGYVDIYAAGFLSGWGHAEWNVKVYVRAYDANTGQYIQSAGYVWSGVVDNNFPWPIHNSHSFENEVAQSSMTFTPTIGHTYYIEAAFEGLSNGFAGAAGVSGGASNLFDWTESSGIKLTSMTIHYPYTLIISSGLGGTTVPAPGSYQYDEGTTVSVQANPSSNYVFDHWVLDGQIRYENPITVTMSNDHNLQAYFAKLVNLSIRVPQAPPEGVQVWIDGNTYIAYASTPASVIVKEGQHTIQVERSFLKEEWMPGYYYIYTFDHWSDGSEQNPRTIYITSDTTLTAYYLRSKYAIV